MQSKRSQTAYRQDVRMIDLHCHLLPGLDDGATNLEMSLAMAQLAVDDGITVVACTPHIHPGIYHNTGSQILAATDRLREALQQAGIDLRLVSGADAHMTVRFTDKLAKREILTLADSRYVLVEPPYHVAPMRLEQFFFEILASGYVPVLTHPERLRWIADLYPAVQRLIRNGVWMQITAGSLIGQFGREPKYWAERMLANGHVHLIASDAHDPHVRVPNLSSGLEFASRHVGEHEATNMVLTRPWGILDNEPPSNLPLALGQQGSALPGTA